MIQWGGLILQPECEDYLDDGDFEPIPGRTLLFRLEPIGLGTPQCEGLTSYLVRVAREHSLPVRRFVSRLLFSKVLDSAPRCDAKFFRQYASTINGLGPYAERFASALNNSTGRRDLELLTLLPWRHLLAPSGKQLTLPWRRWCPNCVARQEYESCGLPGPSETYMPMAWSIASVHSCSVHGVPLSDTCPHCARRQPAIPRRADFANCDFCRRSLIGRVGFPQPSLDHAEDTLPSLSVAEQLICLNGTVDANSVHQRWVDGLSTRIAALGTDRASFCRGVGLNPRAMNAWINRGTCPSIESLAKVLGGLQLSAAELFTPTTFSPESIGATRVCEPVTVIRRRHQHPVEVRVRAAALLDQAAVASRPPTLREIAASLHVSTGFIRYWHPQRVALLRRRHVEVHRTDRLSRLERHRLEVGSAVKLLRASGVFPGRKAVEAAVRAKGATLIDPRNYEAYRSALRSPSEVVDPSLFSMSVQLAGDT